MVTKPMLRWFNLKLLHFSVLTSLYMVSPAHADHLQKIMPPSQLKKLQQNSDKTIARRFHQWQELLNLNGNLSEKQKLQRVNDFFNQMKWSEDQALWQQRDYWATPVESLMKNAGDCEDFSIAKYFALLEMGVPEDKLRVTYVSLKETDNTHMVLAYYPDPEADPLILDNLEKRIKPMSLRHDLVPRFNFNQLGVWQQNQPQHPIASAHDIQRWADLIKRMENMDNPG